MRTIRQFIFLLSLSLAFTLAGTAGRAQAQTVERLCDTAFEDCRAPLWQLIDAETVGIDVAFWFMQDTSYASKLIARHNAGVRVRVLVDPRANPTYAGNGAIIDQLAAAGIPIRYKLRDGILHWKMMLFAGQGKVEFSGANFSPNFFVPSTPYTNYTDEVIYFTDDVNVVNSFRTKFEDHWTSTTRYGNYANITAPPARVYPIHPKDPELNFPQSPDSSEDFYNRTLLHLNRERGKIDIIMYRITNDRYTTATINAVNRGVPVRLLTEQDEYRNTARPWDAYNKDLLYMGGVQIRFRNHQGLNHEKAVVLYQQGMSIFGSSNWTGPSSNYQDEHNYFTVKPWVFQWFVSHFERKWNSEVESKPFVPLPPTAPAYTSPANGVTNQPTTMTLTWEGGPWAHKFDVYFGTDPNPPLLAADQFIGKVDNTVPETYIVTNLQPGTKYYWRIVSKTMANMTASGSTRNFTTSGAPPTVSGVSPNTGLISGGTGVTITGTGFAAGAAVTFGGTAATNVTVVNSTTITATTPAHAAGAADVVVTNSDAQSGTLAGGFTYNTPPPAEIVLYASEAPVRAGNWNVVADATAAGGSRLHNTNLGAPKLTNALASPAHYFELTFNAQAGVPYRLWVRSKADSNYWGNDSYFIQFSGSVTQGGAAQWRIGTTDSTVINLEDCSGCGLSGWGWQDNGWGVGVLGPVVYFQTSGPQTVRIQPREDGFSLDQIVLSPQAYLTQPPGALKNDTVILPKAQ